MAVVYNQFSQFHTILYRIPYCKHVGPQTEIPVLHFTLF